MAAFSDYNKALEASQKSIEEKFGKVSVFWQSTSSIRIETRDTEVFSVV